MHRCNEDTVAQHAGCEAAVYPPALKLLDGKRFAPQLLVG